MKDGYQTKGFVLHNVMVQRIEQFRVASETRTFAGAVRRLLHAGLAGSTDLRIAVENDKIKFLHSLQELGISFCFEGRMELRIEDFINTNSRTQILANHANVSIDEYVAWIENRNRCGFRDENSDSRCSTQAEYANGYFTKTWQTDLCSRHQKIKDNK